MEAAAQGVVNADPDTLRRGQPGAMEYARARPLSVERLERASRKSERDCLLTQRRRHEVEEFIEAHLDIPLTVVDMAACTGLSASHFSRAFTATLKISPHAYLMSRRLTRAQQLITSSDMPLAEIALITGFADQSHLSRRFREVIGVPPSVFRRQYR